MRARCFICHRTRGITEATVTVAVEGRNPQRSTFRLCDQCADRLGGLGPEYLIALCVDQHERIAEARRARMKRKMERSRV